MTAPNITVDDMPAVRSMLAGEGVPVERVEALADALAVSCPSVALAKTRVTSLRSDLPDVFAPVEPVTAADEAALVAADRGWGAGRPEVQAAVARAAERQHTESALMSRLAQLVKGA